LCRALRASSVVVARFSLFASSADYEIRGEIA
jgi:hypothetical protein